MDPEEPEEPIAPNVGAGDVEDATTAPEDERVLVSEVTAVYSYLYASGKLLQEKVTTDGKTETHNFFYDNSGTPYAMQVDGTTYYYITNLQGDVMELVDASGNTVASYTYSPYGKVLTAEGTLADKNPLRYRGYYYDSESGLYYLQSRYYDPNTGRFINADSYAGTGQGMLGYNMFAYCNGSPIQFADYTGYAYCNAMSETITCGIGGGIQFPKIGKSIGRVYDQVKRGLTCGLIMGIQLGISALLLCDDTALATSSSVAEVERNSEREQKAIFPADPYAFNPRGLVRIVYPGSYNGAIIKWVDPVTGNDVFEWNEDLLHGPHYHTKVLLRLEYDSCCVWDASSPVTYLGNEVPIDDGDFYPAAKRLFKTGCFRISKREGDTVDYVMENRFDGVFIGLAYSPDYKVPNVQFLTECELIEGETEWYYYVHDYEKWRVSGTPTFHFGDDGQ